MNRQRILVVDDIPANIKMLHELLKKDYQVGAATNGPEALRLAASKNQI